MVSELSARLMRGHYYNAQPSTTKLMADYTGSRSTGAACVSPTTISDHEPMMSISACTAKLQEISTNQSHSKKQARASCGAIDDTCFKRRKLDELQFAASRVKDDLTKGGLSYPGLDASLRHHLDLESTDDLTRGVTLVGSNSVSSSPFLTNNGSKCSEMASMSDFGSLFSATFACYSVPPAVDVAISPSNFSSNATFVTNSDCSVTSENTSSDISPRLEDGLNSSSKKTVVIVEPTPESKEQSEATALQRRAVYSNPITIRDAFENSDEARIVTLSFAPFLVAHVNPAYTRMTGLFPSAVLGKPFHEVIEDPILKANTVKASSLTSLHDKITTFSQAVDDDTANDNQCRINVSVVGPEPTDRLTSFSWDHHLQKNQITHYLISLKEAKDEGAEVTDDDDEPQDVSAAVMDDPPTVGTMATGHLPVPILETNVAHMPTMRFHCGVMG